MSLHEIGHELVHALVHVDRSVLSLVRQLLLRPGVVARDYVEGRRRRYYGPFGFLVVVVALASGLIGLTGFHVVTSSVPNRLADFLQGHANLLFFVQVPLLAALCRAASWHGRDNYAEWLVLACYASAMHVLFYALVLVPGWYVLRPDPATAARLVYAYAPVWPLYFGLASAQFLPVPRLRGFAKGLAAVLLTQFLTTVAVSGVVNAYLRFFPPP